MIQQIESTVLAFIIGVLLTYFSTRWSKIFKKIDALEYGVQALLRDRMCGMRRYYTDKQKPIPQQEVESFQQLYEAYKQLGGNGYVDNIRDEIGRMPHENH